MPPVSKKISIDLILFRTHHALLGRGEFYSLHRYDCCFVSGSYP
jgi:hypothetical protein